MASYQSNKTSNYLVFAGKILLILIVLYACTVYLNQFFAWLLAIAFVFVRWALVIIVLLLILYILLRLLFGIDVIRYAKDRFLSK